MVLKWGTLYNFVCRCIKIYPADEIKCRRASPDGVAPHDVPGQGALILGVPEWVGHLVDRLYEAPV